MGAARRGPLTKSKAEYVGPLCVDRGPRKDPIRDPWLLKKARGLDITSQVVPSLQSAHP